MRKIKSKKAFEMQFSWIFAIIAGIIVIVLSIYAVTQFVGVKRYEIDTATAKKLSVLIEPLEIGAAVSKTAIINFNRETRIYNNCLDIGNFGKNELRISQKSGLVSKWPPSPSGEINIYNKYIFSKKIEQGKKAYLFAKRFDFPFKISEIIFLSSENYCFIQAPNSIRDEIFDLEPKNIVLSEKLNNCPSKSQKICFGSDFKECDVSVYGTCYDAGCKSQYDSGYALKKNSNEKMYYSGSLIYGVIFSDYETYECNVKRLILRLIHLSSLYKDKEEFVSNRCFSNFAPNLIGIINLARKFQNSEDLALLETQIKELKRKNEEATVCKLF